MKQALHLLNSLKHGGAENVAYNYATILRLLGVDSIFVGEEASAEYVDHLTGAGGRAVEKIDRELIRGADMIFVHSNQNLVRLLPHLGTIRKRGIRVFYIQHLNYSAAKFRLLARLIHLVCTDFIRITPITARLVERFIRIPVHFVVNFFINRYEPGDYPAIRAQVRKELKIDPAKTVLMFSAVFKPGKGLEDFIELAGHFRDRSDWVFLLVGDGPERAVADAYTGNNVVRTGFVNDVERLLIASDIYLFTSRFRQEMMPMALLEAMNCRRRIAAYDLPLINFCLDNRTFENLEEMKTALEKGEIPASFSHYYDKSYAIRAFDTILRGEIFSNDTEPRPRHNTPHRRF